MHHDTSSLDQKGGYLRCTFLDLSLAFNAVPSRQIVDLLSMCCAPCYLVDLVSTYILDRTQYAQHGKIMYDLLPNDCGVPQGDVLAPSFFNHHTDSLRSTNDCHLLKYADDIAVCSPSSSDITRLSAALQHVSAWSRNHGLLLNESKCVECIFTCVHLLFFLTP